MVADASAVINLNATAYALQILCLVPHSFLVTENAVVELVNGREFGHDDADLLDGLVECGRIVRSELGTQGSSVYETLVSGSTEETLDDGEAATIGLSLEMNAIALIDERKARRMCQSSYPALEIISTVDILLHPKMEEALGADLQATAVFNALLHARMRVPNEHLSAVVSLIGIERVRMCPSLPFHVRR